MTHTPGPFFYDKRTESVGCPAGWIASVQHTSKGDGEFGNPDDDGELFAASPDLLAACEASEVFWDHYINCSYCKGVTFCGDAMILASDMTQVRKAAIAKARGDVRPALTKKGE
jgi:hypothetical protein